MDDFRNLEHLLHQMIEERELPLLSMAVWRRGQEVFHQVEGMASIDRGLPNTDESLFRIFSMTKVVTTVAFLQLYEQGKVTLNDPVSKYIPSFAHQKVWSVDVHGNNRLTEARRPNTLWNLLTMTSGIPYYHPGRSFVEDRMAEVWADMDDHIRAGQPYDNYAMAMKIGENPLLFEPGTHYHYGLGIDVIGSIIQVVSGMRLGDYFRKYIFDPLGMKDTDFYVPQEKLARLVDFYDRDAQGRFTPSHHFQDLRQLKRPAYEEGGDGLVTTLSDYLTFARMLLHYGQGDDGRRILGRKTVELMSSNHLPTALLDDVSTGMSSVRGYGFGLGCRVNLDPARTGINGSAGEFGWFGHGGSWFCVDPKEDMVALFLTQVIFASGTNFNITPRMNAALYSAF